MEKNKQDQRRVHPKNLFGDKTAKSEAQPEPAKRKRSAMEPGHSAQSRANSATAARKL